MTERIAPKCCAGKPMVYRAYDRTFYCPRCHRQKPADPK